MSKLKVGIIGTGGISHEHIKAYLNNPRVELYAFCDIDPQQLAKMAEQYGVERTFDDHRAMLALPELDAVSVCTWNAAHAPVTIDALNAGKHVLCEKPMATTPAEARAMKQAADAAGKLLMIGFVRRFGNDCRILEDFIEGGFLGDIYYAKATYLRRHGAPGGWFGEQALSGGGPLIDLGVHVLDLTRYLMGNPKPVSVYGATFGKLGNRPGVKTGVAYQSVRAGRQDVFDVEDLATALVRYDNGAVLSLEASFSLNLKNDQGTIQLFGTKGGAKLDPELELYTEANGYLADMQLATRTSLSFDGLFAGEIDHFAACILDGVPCRAPADDGVVVMDILDAIYRSAASGHEVELGKDIQS